jgi:hypothetical protein
MKGDLFLLNATIDAFNLRELELLGRHTWQITLASKSWTESDPFFTEWEVHFPRTIVLALSCEIFKHSPLYLDS